MSAIDYLVENIWGKGEPTLHQKVIIERAREIEKQQIGYTKEDVLKAGEIGEINHYDYKHIVKLLDEARAINQKNGTTTFR